jgi:hypothetical protein
MLVAALEVPCMALADEVMPFVIPAASPLKAAGKLEAREPRRFRGEEQVSGDCIAVWENTGSAAPLPSYRIVLDAASAKHFPQSQGDDIEAIDVANGPEILIAMTDAQQARQLINDRHVKRLRVRGTFMISEYETSIDCDSPWARARVLSVSREAIAVLPVDMPARC